MVGASTANEWVTLAAAIITVVVGGFFALRQRGIEIQATEGIAKGYSDLLHDQKSVMDSRIDVLEEARNEDRAIIDALKIDVAKTRDAESKCLARLREVYIQLDAEKARGEDRDQMILVMRQEIRRLGGSMA